MVKNKRLIEEPLPLRLIIQRAMRPEVSHSHRKSSNFSPV